MADDIADSWEDLENGEDLDKKLDKLAQPAKMKEENGTAIPKLQEDTSGRTAYQPTIKILKRETNNTQNNCSPTDRVPSKPIKTFEEREAAYAEARLRILGAAVNPEEELQPPSTAGSESSVKSDSSPPASVTSSPASSSVKLEQNTESSIPAAPR